MNTTIRSATASAAAASPTASATTARTPPAASGDAAADTTPLETPKPLRFPWLSRLSHELEPAAKQKSTFPSAPVLGDNVDKKA